MESYSEMTDADRQRVGVILNAIAAAVGGNVQWGAKNYLDVWITEHRTTAERHATNRLTFATWALVAATCLAGRGDGRSCLRDRTAHLSS